jgi:hypothetical protein
MQQAHSPIDYNVICHQNGFQHNNLLLTYYTSDPPFLGRLLFNYKLRYYCEKYEKILTSGFVHYHFPLNA